MKQLFYDIQLFGLAYPIKWPIALLLNRLFPGYWYALAAWALGAISWREIEYDGEVVSAADFADFTEAADTPF